MATQTAAQKKAAAKAKAAAAKKSTGTKPATKKGGTTKAATTKATRGKTTAKAKDDTVDRSALRAERDAQNTERMLEMREEEMSWSEIGTELGITPGKAQFLLMLHKVATGEVKRLTFKAGDDAALAKVVKTARDKADEFSSWGWISARTGVSEPKLKSVHEEHNGWSPRTENISIVRAAKNGGGTAKATGRKTTAGAKGKATASKAAKAKAKARSRGKEASPTS